MNEASRTYPAEERTRDLLEVVESCIKKLKQIHIFRNHSELNEASRTYPAEERTRDLLEVVESCTKKLKQTLIIRSEAN